MEAHERRLPRLVLVPVLVMSAVAGLALAVLGWSGWLLAPAVLVLGLVGRTTGARWADWAVPIGVGLVLGTLIYLLVNAPPAAESTARHTWNEELFTCRGARPHGDDDLSPRS